jgi:hypothetical protein
MGIPNGNVNQTGTYTLNGATAIFSSGATVIGTAVLTGNNLTLTLNPASDAPGTYSFTKSGGNNDGSGNGKDHGDGTGKDDGGKTGAQVRVSFTEPQDKTITVTQTPGTGSLTVSVSGSFSKYRWFLDGVLLPNETKDSLTLDVSGLSPRRHELTVFVTGEDGAEYAKALRFTTWK